MTTAIDDRVITYWVITGVLLVYEEDFLVQEMTNFVAAELDSPHIPRVSNKGLGKGGAFHFS